MPYTRGSEWRKWDLHLHSPATLLNNQFEGATDVEKWERYITKLESLPDVCALGITDYCAIDGYRKVREFQAAGRLSNVAFVFPNVELRLLPVTQQSKAINIHFLFSPEIADQLDTLFFQALEFRYNDCTYRCTRNDLIRFGRIFRNDQSLAEHVAYEDAVNQCKITLDQIHHLLKRHRELRENCLIAVANGSNDGNSGIQHSSLVATREEIYRAAQIIFSGNPNDTAYFLGQGADSIDEVKRKCGGLKPSVIGSDSHELSRVCAPALNRFTWIKADPTFDGLRQIVFEPEARVRIQETNPANDFTKPYFAAVRLTAPTPVFVPNPKYEGPQFSATQELPLNRDLVCIIGGRGTGKSCLLDYMGNSFSAETRWSEFAYSNSFVITYNKDSTDAVSHHAAEGAKLPFVYISQSEVKRKIDDGTVGTEIKRMLGIPEAAFDIEVETKISKLLGDVSGVEQWFNQKSQTGERIFDQDSVSQQLAKNEALLSSITTEQNREKLDRFTKNVAEHHEIKRRGKLLSDLLTELQAVATKLNQQINQLGDASIPQVNFMTQQEAIKALDKQFVERLIVLDKEIDTIRSEFTKIYTGDLSALLGNAEAYRKEIATLKERVAQIGVKQKELAEAKAARDEIADLIAKEMLRQKEEIDARWEKVREGQPEWEEPQRKLMAKILADRGIHLEGQVIFDSKRFLDRLTPVLDKRYFKTAGGQTPEQRILAAFPITDIDSFCVFMREKLHSVSGEQVIGNLLDVFYDLEQRSHYLFVEPRIFYNGVPLERLSVGQKGTVYLCLKLATQTFSQPLLFDQPEDDLDNEFIIKELVDIFREIKRFRQVILVTHNANLVVNADTEQVIVAENRSGVLRYEPGSLENPDTNKAIRRILEGGDEAFKRRERRYNMG
jgi:hypothetical protein